MCRKKMMPKKRNDPATNVSALLNLLLLGSVMDADVGGVRVFGLSDEDDDSGNKDKHEDKPDNCGKCPVCILKRALSGAALKTVPCGVCEFAKLHVVDMQTTMNTILLQMKEVQKQITASADTLKKTVALEHLKFAAPCDEQTLTDIRKLRATVVNINETLKDCYTKLP